MIKKAFKTYLSRHVEVIVFALGISVFRVAMESSGGPLLSGKEMLHWAGVLSFAVVVYACVRALWDWCRAYYRRLRLFWTAWRGLPSGVCPACRNETREAVIQERMRA